MSILGSAKQGIKQGLKRGVKQKAKKTYRDQAKSEFAYSYKDGAKAKPKNKKQRVGKAKAFKSKPKDKDVLSPNASAKIRGKADQKKKRRARGFRNLKSKITTRQKQIGVSATGGIIGYAGGKAIENKLIERKAAKYAKKHNVSVATAKKRIRAARKLF